MSHKKDQGFLKSEWFLAVLLCLNGGGIWYLLSSPVLFPQTQHRFLVLTQMERFGGAIARKDMNTIRRCLGQFEKNGEFPKIVTTGNGILGKKRVSETDFRQLTEMCLAEVQNAFSQEEPSPDTTRGLVGKSLGGMNLLLALVWGWALGTDQRKRETLEAEIEQAKGIIENTRTETKNNLGHLCREKIELKQLQKEWKEVSAVDYDTQVPLALTPLAGLERLVEEIKTHPPENIFCFAFDFDNFGRIRPAYGGQSVAEIMEATGERVTAQLRKTSDWLVHVQGRDEFQIFCCGYEWSACQERVERIFQGFETPFRTKAGEIRLTISGGLAALSEIAEAENLKSLVRLNPSEFPDYLKNDREMVQQSVSRFLDLSVAYAYQAKTAGKNQVFARLGRILPCQTSQSS